MAKNVHEKKKRIARVTSFDNHEYHDIVSSIMNGMDNNLPSIYSNKFEMDLFESGKIFSENKTQKVEIAKTKQNCVNINKSKNFRLSRKFPLMEKSQKALKQLKHNRKIPKARAHLAGLSDSPLAKLKKNKVKEKNIGNAHNKKGTDKTVHRKVTTPGNERKRNLIKEQKNEIACMKNKPYVMNKNSAIKESSNLLNNNSKESDSSSDTEFERFIQDEKKDLSKNQKSNKLSLNKSKKMGKRASTKGISRSVSREKYSDTSDEASELPKPYYKSNKRIKNKHKTACNRQSRLSVKKNNEMDIVYNETNDSSESDVVGLAPCNNSCSEIAKEIGNESNSVPKFNLPLQKTSAISSLVSNNQLKSNDQPNIPHAVSLMDNGQPNVLYNAPHPPIVNDQPNLTQKVNVSPLADNRFSSIVKNETSSICDIKNDSVLLNRSAPKSPDQSLLIDLVESDNECENTFTLAPKIVKVSGPNKVLSHLEESDVEIVDVIVHDLPQKKKVEPKSSKENILMIKTEPVIQSENILNKKVKNEPCDCEIIFDAASTSNITKMAIQKCSNLSIKNEKDLEKSTVSVNVPNNGSFAPEKKNKLAQKEEMLHEVACSNLRNTGNIHKCLEPLENERMTDLHLVDIKSLLEALKKEFSTYKEIIQTEQSVEETFKLLERRQAEKLTSLKSQITEYLKSSGINDDCNAIKNAMNSLLDTQLSNPKSLKDTVQDVSVQDLKTLESMNIVPLSSIPENDIKPNVSQLQCILKEKESTSYETNNMSFGEKCIVCAKDASAACQQCAKVFFCSNECGVKYWENGHKNTCVK